MARAIDADALKKELAPYEENDFSQQIDVILKIVDAQPTLTPPNEWVSVEDEIPSDDDDGLEFFCMTNATGKCGGVLPLEWEVSTIRGKTVRRWKWRSRISPWAVTHWMKRPAPPGENNNVSTKAPNEPLTQADLDSMDYDKVWIDYGDNGEWALVVYGRIYSLSNLEGCGFEDILRDEVAGETMDRPSGDYTAYRRPPEGEEDT